MLKILIALIGILFSSGTIAGICHVYLPPDCKEVTDSDISFYKNNSSLSHYTLAVEVGCTIDLESEYVDNLTVGDIFYNHKKFTVSTFVKKNNRFNDYTILFYKYRKPMDITKIPYVECNFN